MELAPLVAAGHNDTQCLICAQRILYCFVPQYFRTKLFNDPLPQQKLFATSWISGLRGWAALMVVLYHTSLPFDDIRTFPNGGQRWSKWVFLPIVHLPFSGHALVSLFFVVGGYLLSLNSLRLLDSSKSESSGKILQNLSRSVFRRFFRLYLPVMAISFLYIVGTFCGMRDFMMLRFHWGKDFPGYVVPALLPRTTLSTQISHWTLEMRALINIFVHHPAYIETDPNLWTIPIEFRSSLALFLCILFVAYLRPYLRLGALVFLGMYSLWHGGWDTALYILGAATVQFGILCSRTPTPTKDFIDLSQEEKLEPAKPRDIMPQVLRTGLIYLTVFFSLWVMSMPEANIHLTPGFRTLLRWTPEWFQPKFRFYPTIACVTLVNALNLCQPDSFLRRPLNHPFSQYLGRLSFALYLVHHALLYSFGLYTPIIMWFVLPRYNAVGYVLGFSLAVLINLAIFLCVADVVNREIEVRLVRFTLWLERICNEPDE